MLERQDRDRKEVVNDRQAQYTKQLLLPCDRFEQQRGVERDRRYAGVLGPAYYQSPWFLSGCVAAFLDMPWRLYRLRLQ